MEWVKGFLTPLIEIIFIGGFVLVISFYIIKGLNNAWQKSWKFIIKYSIFRKKYPEKTVVWCWEAIKSGIGYYEARKFLMVKSIDPKTINETLWIYDKILIEMGNKGKKLEGKKVEQNLPNL
jgi:hypothetical protein